MVIGWLNLIIMITIIKTCTSLNKGFIVTYFTIIWVISRVKFNGNLCVWYNLLHCLPKILCILFKLTIQLIGQLDNYYGFDVTFIFLFYYQTTSLIK